MYTYILTYEYYFTVTMQKNKDFPKMVVESRSVSGENQQSADTGSNASLEWFNNFLWI